MAMSKVEELCWEWEASCKLTLKPINDEKDGFELADGGTLVLV